MKLKCHRQTPDQDLASSIEQFAKVLEMNVENGVLAQGTEGFNAEIRARLG